MRYLLPVLIVFSVIVYPLTLWTDRTLEFWLTYFKGREIEVSNWISFGVTVLLNGIIFGANLVSELVRLAVN